MQKIFSIAIDGPAGAGKSTVARAAAQALGAMYLDTGAMYRTVGLHFLRANLLENPDEIARRVDGVSVQVKFEGGAQHMLLENEDVTEAIRTPEASMAASAVGAVPEVRAYLLEQQRSLARQYDVIMDGRDIGTVVLPDADVKIFLTATAEDRARRRYEELRERGNDVDFDTVLRDIIARDERDTRRAAAPLRQAEDAVAVDTTGNTLEESFRLLLDVARKGVGA